MACLAADQQAGCGQTRTTSLLSSQTSAALRCTRATNETRAALLIAKSRRKQLGLFPGSMAACMRGAHRIQKQAKVCHSPPKEACEDCVAAPKLQIRCNATPGGLLRRAVTCTRSAVTTVLLYPTNDLSTSASIPAVVAMVGRCQEVSVAFHL